VRYTTGVRKRVKRGRRRRQEEGKGGEGGREGRMKEAGGTICRESGDRSTGATLKGVGGRPQQRHEGIKYP
jgi:hypothetical protein